MMRSWFQRNAKTLVVASALVSVVTHAGVIVGWVLATLPEPGMPRYSLANHPVEYRPPEDRVPTQAGTRETITYIKLETPGLGTGEGARQAGFEVTPKTTDQSAGRDTAAKDTAVVAIAPTKGPDSVYSVLDVDTAVVRSTKSAAPAYPLKLLQGHVQGYVNAQYTVDTTGFADTASFVVLEATNKEFITAVKEALPYMRFSPAKIGPMKVRQQVQQQFSFRITDTLPPAPKKRP